MSEDQERRKKMGGMCCGPWAGHGHPASRGRIGLLMIAAGAIWLGSVTGLLDFSWLHGFPFWPAALILFGAWLVYRGSVDGRRETILTAKDRRHSMETTFAGMMEGCMKGMSDEERKKMMEKMAAMCPCMGAKQFSAEDGKAMMEKMMAFCGSMMGPKAAAQTGGTEKAS